MRLLACTVEDRLGCGPESYHSSSVKSCRRKWRRANLKRYRQGNKILRWTQVTRVRPGHVLADTLAFTERLHAELQQYHRSRSFLWFWLKGDWLHFRMVRVPFLQSDLGAPHSIDSKVAPVVEGIPATAGIRVLIANYYRLCQFVRGMSGVLPEAIARPHQQLRPAVVVLPMDK